MLSHEERQATARAAVAFITGRSADELARPVPNCPGWTVYNAAAHIGRVAIAWEEMISSSPDDPESRQRGYDRSGQQPPGTPVAELAAWANAAIDRLDGDLDRPCYFSMTGGEGTVALWAWHAATELGIHRLDVEAALGYEHSLSETQALDAVTYTAHYFLPAMRRATGTDPGPLSIVLDGAAGPVGRVDLPAA
ncbi:MAG: maleylpyruvate isomerase N-terminal domain-containing protein, partial [Actinomycetota bacterium]